VGKQIIKVEGSITLWIWHAMPLLKIVSIEPGFFIKIYWCPIQSDSLNAFSLSPKFINYFPMMHDSWFVVLCWVFVCSGLHGLGLLSQIDLVCTSSTIMSFQVSSTSSYHPLGGKYKRNTQGFAMIIPEFLCVTMHLHRPNLKMY